jgi:hypothetical protein
MCEALDSIPSTEKKKKLRKKGKRGDKSVTIWGKLERAVVPLVPGGVCADLPHSRVGGVWWL